MKHVEIKLFLTFFITYITFISFFEWNEISTLNSGLTLACQNSYEMSGLPDETHFRTGDTIYVDGKIYSDKLIGMVLLMYPLVKPYCAIFGFPEGKTYWILVWILTATLSSLFAALTCILIFRITKHFSSSKEHQIFAALFYGFGSMAFYYATSIKRHAATTFFAFLAFYLLFNIKYRNEEPKWLPFAAGLSAGLALLIDYLAFPVLFGCLIYTLALRQKNSTVLFFAGTLPMVLILLFYNYAIFGTFLAISYSYSDINVFKEGTNLDIPTYFNIISSRGSLILALCLRLFDKTIRILFFPYRGLFIYAPFLLLSIIGLRKLYLRYKWETYIIVLQFLAILFFVIFGGHLWWGGTGYGHRFFLIMLPFFILPLIFTLKRLKIKIIIALLIISFGISILSTQQTEWVLFSYGSAVHRVIYNDFCYLREIENPITGYYLPLFLAFGPQSPVIGNILGFDQDNELNIQRTMPRYLNLLVVLIILGIIWRSELFRFVRRKKRLAIIILSVVLMLILARVVFDSHNNNYAQARLHKFYEDRRCPDNALSKLFGPIPLWVEERGNRIHRELYGFIPPIPYSLWVDENLPVDIGENRNWKRPSVLMTKIHGSYANATINIYNKQNDGLPILLNFVVYVNQDEPKDFTVFHNDDEVAKLVALRKTIRHGIYLNLTPGWNSIRFNGNETCNEILLCEDLYFKKIQIVNAELHDIFYYGKDWLEDLYKYLERPKMYVNNGTIIYNSTRDINKTLKFKLYSNEINRTLITYLNGKHIGTFNISNDWYYQNVIQLNLTLNKGTNILEFQTPEPCYDYPTNYRRDYCISFIAVMDYNSVVSFK